MPQLARTLWLVVLATMALGHAQPADAANLEYVRLHTGFCRTIHVTPEDVARVG